MAVSVYPTGTTIYYPEKCWSGYTVFHIEGVGTTLIDMNGRIVKQWKGLHGFPPKIFPGGVLMASTGIRIAKHGFFDYFDLTQVDWDGNIKWQFNKYDLITDPGQQPRWMARQHHDFQREGNPVGYYVPGMEPLTDGGNTLILAHKNVKNSKITDKLLVDDTFVEVDWAGKIVWEWICSDHVDEMGFSKEARETMYRDAHIVNIGVDVADWMHINSMSPLGPNKWFDAGDRRFHPDNIIWDGRSANLTAITDKKTGKIVWRVGPEFAESSFSKLGQIIGQHHAHMIPRGLPGEGNILIFDNGGWAGYGAPNPSAPTGVDNVRRDYSRVLEFDPVTLDIVWQYTPAEAGFSIPQNAFWFYSGFVSSAQRLPNGNTLITEGAAGRIFEVTADHEIVWEYVSPYFDKRFSMNLVYRAYRVPYQWVPQLSKPIEKPVPRIDNSKFRVTASIMEQPSDITTEDAHFTQFCILPEKRDK